MAEKNSEMPDPEQLRQIFQVFNEGIPEMLEKITKILYNPEEGEKFGLSVASFYKSLMASGMTSEQAFSLTKEYLNNVSLGGMLKNIFSGNMSKDMGRGEKH